MPVRPGLRLRVVVHLRAVTASCRVARGDPTRLHRVSPRSSNALETRATKLGTAQPGNGSMSAGPIGRIVVAWLMAGPTAGLALLLGPLSGAREHVITGTLLLASASSWALLGRLSVAWTSTPQRWASVVAGVMGVAGASLLAFAPGDAAIDALGWVWPPLVVALAGLAAGQARRHLRSRTRRSIVYPLLALYAISGLAGGWQTIRESIDRRRQLPPGRLIDVGGHRLHLQCIGVGAPTVVFESGLGETSASWAWIVSAVGRDTTACVYDRAGRGWSDPAAVPQDGDALATDLETLLARGGVPRPLVLVGHSSGAVYVRIFTARYPELVAGVVLLDGQPAEAFERLPGYPAFYRRLRRISALLPILARLGVGRLAFHDSFESLPAPARDVQRRHHASARLYGSLRDEVSALPAALRQARASPGMGARPLVVVTASRDALPGWAALQDELATLSTRSQHRVVPCTHDALVSDRVAAEASTQAVRDVVGAVRHHTF